MTVVVDASVVVAALVDGGRNGQWAESVLLADPLVAPALMPAEVGNVLRRAWLAGDLSEDVAAQAHADLLALRAKLLPYEPFALRIWDLRATLTAYDAWTVAVAEILDVPLATLDRRMTRAPGPRCTFRTPPA